MWLLVPVATRTTLVVTLREISIRTRVYPRQNLHLCVGSVSKRYTVELSRLPRHRDSNDFFLALT